MTPEAMFWTAVIGAVGLVLDRLYNAYTQHQIRMHQMLLADKADEIKKTTLQAAKVGEETAIKTEIGMQALHEQNNSAASENRNLLREANKTIADMQVVIGRFQEREGAATAAAAAVAAVLAATAAPPALAPPPAIVDKNGVDVVHHPVDGVTHLEAPISLEVHAPSQTP